MLSNLVPSIFSATFKKSLQNGIELGFHLLLQLFGKLINEVRVNDVVLIVWIGLVTIAPHVASRLDLASLLLP